MSNRSASGWPCLPRRTRRLDIYLIQEKLVDNLIRFGLSLCLSLSVLGCSGSSGGGPVPPAPSRTPFEGVTPVAYLVGTNPNSVSVGDFDEDGIVDLAVCNQDTDDVSILIGDGSAGQGDGTFEDEVFYLVGDLPQAVSAGDFDGDGILDLTCAIDNANAISVLFGGGAAGVGDGTFSTPSGYATTARPAGIVAADFDGDGLDDIASASQSGDTCSVFLAAGAGLFAARVDYAVHGHPQHIATADLNDDDAVDLITSNYLTNDVGVLLSNGDGSFQAADYYAVDGWPAGIRSADFDGDGVPDVAVACWDGGEVAVLTANSALDGTLLAAEYFPTGTNPSGVACADFDLDSRVDLAVSNSADDTVSILLGNGDGTFEEQQVIFAGLTPRGLVAADFNDDGAPDLAITNYDFEAVAILINVN